MIQGFKDSKIQRFPAEGAGLRFATQEFKDSSSWVQCRDLKSFCGLLCFSVSVALEIRAFVARKFKDSKIQGLASLSSLRSVQGFPAEGAGLRFATQEFKDSSSWVQCRDLKSFCGLLCFRVSVAQEIRAFVAKRFKVVYRQSSILK
ncbi:hypothetical protein TBC1_11754 [Lentimicrobium saccharophilum]|uniref:Uncharacterized protein n=1 Tax=Lentimicrobium saccharophilum TaxID=1678841 RepID=A0A0S7BXZ1_9BACT|nr:hypothetical protein [Lentimicrobium saccharophilum]GAP42622.1 hypothetical protein TBC1_11754 [Lentimicrobium saccharophilum]